MNVGKQEKFDEVSIDTPRGSVLRWDQQKEEEENQRKQ